MPFAMCHVHTMQASRRGFTSRASYACLLRMPPLRPRHMPPAHASLLQAHEEVKEALKQQEERGRALEAERSYLEDELRSLQEEHEALKHLHR